MSTTTNSRHARNGTQTRNVSAMSSVHDRPPPPPHGMTTPPRISTNGGVFTPLLQPHVSSSSTTIKSPWSGSHLVFTCREAVTVVAAECFWILFRYACSKLHLLRRTMIIAAKEPDSFWWRFLQVLLWLRIQEITSVIPYWPTRVCEILWQHPQNSRAPARKVGFAIGTVLFIHIWIRMFLYSYLLKGPIIPVSSSSIELDSWALQVVYQTLPSSTGTI
jgi:hypothetical protein